MATIAGQTPAMPPKLLEAELDLNPESSCSTMCQSSLLNSEYDCEVKAIEKVKPE